MSSSDPVVIVGAGTFGLSTALQLLRSGYNNITLYDPYPIPSPLSAGNDVNKILQCSVENTFYAELALEALDLWQNDPVYKPAFHETGIVYAATDKKLDYLARRKRFITEKGVAFTDITSSDEFSSLFPSIDLEDKQRFAGWKGFYQNEKCGWTYAAQALDSAAKEITRLGGRFVTESVEEVLFDSVSGDVTGIRTLSGSIVKSEKVVITAGANSYKFVDFKGQLLAKCWTVGHIQLTEAEAKALKNIPVLLNLEHGFLFEPDANNDLKFCNEFPGYINLTSDSQSIPIYRDQVPKEAEVYMRKFLGEVFPNLAQRPFNVSKICWCTDTPDRHFLIGSHPEHKGLVLGTGDSGQGFKYMPNVGKYIAEVVMNGDEGLEPLKRDLWKWRPEVAATRDIYNNQGREGGINVIKDLKEVSEWTDGLIPGL